MHFQWYPGHMTKARRMMQEDMKLVDLVIELVDARIPFSSKNPDIDKLAGNKSRIILLNKADMSDKKSTEEWKAYYEDKGFHVALINSKSGSGVKQIQTLVDTACQAKIERDRKRGILNRPIRAMVVGIPNVGKSTFINSFAGKACAKTGNKPGVTKGKQWIRLSKKVELLDTPGILWPKFEDQRVGLMLAFIGSINDNLLYSIELSLELLIHLANRYPQAIINRYELTDVNMESVEDEASASLLLAKIAEKRACLTKGGEPDLERAGKLVLEDFRGQKLGNITLELPTDYIENEPIKA